jgi:hypothetical protein
MVFIHVNSTIKLNPSRDVVAVVNVVAVVKVTSSAQPVGPLVHRLRCHHLPRPVLSCLLAHLASAILMVSHRAVYTCQPTSFQLIYGFTYHLV